MGVRLTIMEFLAKAKSKHGDKYDYSKIQYLYEKDKVIIRCKKHNIEFAQAVAKHLAGQGCRKCSFESSSTKNRLGIDRFIKKAREIHGDRYGYDRVVYKNNSTKVIISCAEHGDFLQSPGNHTHKTYPQGCPECGGRTVWTQDKFIERAKEIHKLKYDYGKVAFVDTIKRVTIICPTHGEFHQKPAKHLSGQGCPKCASNFRGSTEGFIDKAKEIHGTKYNYDKVVYVGHHQKVTITCPIHGDFEQSPASHTLKLHPQGCPKCSGRYPITTEDFIERANDRHDKLYDYSRTVYKSMNKSVKIICPYHGEFEQQASVHLSGSGCQRCRLPKGEQVIHRILKDYGLKFENQYSFDDCRSTHPLPFDFFITHNDKRYLIEYNGEQHYRPVNFGGNSNGKDILHEVQARDKLKREYAEKNNIHMLIIKYDEIKAAPGIIKEFLNLD